MKPISIRDLTTIVGGKKLRGAEEILIQYGAYRLKQVKQQNTALFTSRHIVNWKRLEPFLPIVLVTDWHYKESELPKQVFVIQVTNPEESYWKFVQFYQSQFQIPIIAITGTSGKTTTKEMIKHILSANKKVAATNLSNNSRTAYLQYLLSIDEETEVAIIETAVGSPGDIRRAGEYFQPTVGIITNIGAHHLNYCKTLEGYVGAKGEMIEIIHPQGTLLLNAEDENIKKININNFKGRIKKFGKNPSSDFRASHIRYTKQGMEFTLFHQDKPYKISVPGFGEHQVYNALAAIAAVHEVGVSILQAAKQLKSFKQLNKQLQVFEGINDSILIDDTWSITTTSLEAALKVLNALGKDKKKIAVVGTITDLGAWGYVIHEQAGKLINDIGVDVLITIGKHARIMAEEAVKLGFSSPVYSFNNNVYAFELLQKIVDAKTIVLIKGDMYSKAIFELASKLKKKGKISSE